jgi:hypothetical protein
VPILGFRPSHDQLQLVSPPRTPVSMARPKWRKPRAELMGRSPYIGRFQPTFARPQTPREMEKMCSACRRQFT